MEIINFKLMRLLYITVLLALIVGCHPSSQAPEPSMPLQAEVPLSQQLIIQTEAKLIPKIEKDYRHIELRYMKTISKSSGIFLFYVNHQNMSMDALLKTLRRDVRITQVQTNKAVTPR